MKGMGGFVLSECPSRPSDFITSVAQLRPSPMNTPIHRQKTLPIRPSTSKKLKLPIFQSPSGISSLTLNNHTVSWGKKDVEPISSNWKEALLFPTSDEAEMFWFGQPSSARKFEASEFRPVVHRGLMLPPGVGPHTAMDLAIRYKDEQSFPLFAPGCGPESPVKSKHRLDQPRAYSYTCADEEVETEAEEEDDFEEVVSLHAGFSLDLLQYLL